MRRVKARQLIPDDKINERIAEIKERADDIERRRIDSEWIPKSDMTFQWWTYWEASNFVTLPFGGAIVDQPEWIWSDFAGFSELEEHQELWHEHERLVERQGSKHG